MRLINIQHNTGVSNKLKHFNAANRPFARSGHMVRNKLHHVGRKLRSGTSETKELVPVQPDFPLF